jgi:hypothetical protein
MCPSCSFIHQVSFMYAYLGLRFSYIYAKKNISRRKENAAAKTNTLEKGPELHGQPIKVYRLTQN